LSLKEDIQGVKEQLTAEEQFLENSIIVERFAKKYKKLIFGAIGAVVVVVLAGTAYNMQVDATKVDANAAFLLLQKDPSNESKITELRRLNPQMYDLFLLNSAVENSDLESLKKLSNSSNGVISDIATYQIATIDENLAELESYSMKQDALYKDFSLLNSALLLMQKGDITSAHQKLNSITSESPMFKVAQSYLHYGIK